MTKRTTWRILMMKVAVWMLLLSSVCLVLLAVYGSCQLYTRTDRLDLAESQKAEIANLRTRLTFLQNNDWGHIIEQLPPIIRDELAAMNELIKQKKHREYERYEMSLLTEKEIDG